MTLAKICGVTTPEALNAAIDGGAAFIGLVAYPRSPRFVSTFRVLALLEEAGISSRRPHPARFVAVTVDADDILLESIRRDFEPAYIQLHGSETIERAARVREITGAGIIKAISVSGPGYLDQVGAWAEAADHLLFDARTPPGSHIPGGMGVTFDWTLLADLTLDKPWFLAGGLTPETVGDAIRQTGAPMVDVSSGVESAPGAKDIALIKAFLDQVQTVSPRQ